MWPPAAQTLWVIRSWRCNFLVLLTKLEVKNLLVEWHGWCEVWGHQQELPGLTGLLLRSLSLTLSLSLSLSDYDLLSIQSEKPPEPHLHQLSPQKVETFLTCPPSYPDDRRLIPEEFEETSNSQSNNTQFNNSQSNNQYHYKSLPH